MKLLMSPQKTFFGSEWNDNRVVTCLRSSMSNELLWIIYKCSYLTSHFWLRFIVPWHLSWPLSVEPLGTEGH